MADINGVRRPVFDVLMMIIPVRIFHGKEEAEDAKHPTRTSYYEDRSRHRLRSAHRIRYPKYYPASEKEEKTKDKHDHATIGRLSAKFLIRFHHVHDLADFKTVRILLLTGVGYL